MGAPLVSFLTRYRKDPAALSRSLIVPVLLVDAFTDASPPSATSEDPDLETHRLRTVSAVGEVLWVGGEPQVFELRKQKENAFPRGVTVGRTRNNDVVLDHSSVSRFHGWFEWSREDRRWRVVDAGSKNGTLLGGTKLTAKHAVDLGPDTPLCFGRIQARFFTPEAFFALLARRLQEGSPPPR